MSQANEVLIRVVVDRTVAELQQYAHLREKNIARGVDTPEFAAVLIGRYGEGATMVVRILSEYL